MWCSFRLHGAENMPRSSIVYTLKDQELWAEASELNRIKEIPCGLARQEDYKIGNFRFCSDGNLIHRWLGKGVWSPSPGELFMDEVEMDEG